MSKHHRGWRVALITLGVLSAGVTGLCLVTFGPVGPGGAHHSPSLNWSLLKSELKEGESAVYYHGAKVAEGVLQGGVLEFDFDVPSEHDPKDYVLCFTKDGKILEQVRALDRVELNKVFVGQEE